MLAQADGPDHDARTGATPRATAGVAPQPPAMGVRGGSAAALRRPGRRSRLRSPVAVGPGRRGMGGGDMARGLRRPRPGPGRELRRAGGTGARPCPRAGRAHRREPGRTDTAGARDGRPEGAVAALDPPRRRAVVPACSPSPTRDPTSPRCAPRPGPWTVAGSSTDARSGPRTREFADWGVCLARSDPAAPKHKGLSFFVVDMHAPGVGVHPLVQLTGEAEFNEVELNDVFVPDDQLVGAPGEGWRVAGSTLSHERGVNPRQLVIHLQHLEELPVGGGGFGRVRRHALAPPAGPGLRRGAAVPAAQLALALQAPTRPRARPRREHPQAVLERDEQAPPQPGARGPRPGRPPVATTPPPTPGPDRGSGHGSTIRRRRSSRAPTRSSTT